jgi:hypothetical protein
VGACECRDAQPSQENVKRKHLLCQSIAKSYSVWISSPDDIFFSERQRIPRDRSVLMRDCRIIVRCPSGKIGLKWCTPVQIWPYASCTFVQSIDRNRERPTFPPASRCPEDATRCSVLKGGIVDPMIGPRASFIALLESLHYNARITNRSCFNE